MIALKLSRTADWRLSIAHKYQDDNRNGKAAQKLADFAAEADEIPDDVWDVLAPHFHRSSERFAGAISTTNRCVGFNPAVVELDTYWRCLVANVRSAFEVN